MAGRMAQHTPAALSRQTVQLPRGALQRGGGVSLGYPGGRTGSGGFEEENLRNGQHMPSAKVQGLANEIEQLESKYEQLEQRNAWLTRKLLQRQRRFIEWMMLGTFAACLRNGFEAWRELVHELSLERHLDGQTVSLDQCQQVAKELGTALAQEREARRACEDAHVAARDDLDRALQEEKRLRQQFEEHQEQLEMLERRVQEAESCVMRSQADAQAVVESAELYQQRVREVVAEEEAEVGSGGSLRGESPIEHSVRLRNEASSIVRKVSGLLPPQRHPSPQPLPRRRRPPSPEREP